MHTEYDKYLAMLEPALLACIPDVDDGCGALRESMRYSLLAGGKRIRPVLALEFCRVSGGDPEKALPVACAVEMLHTYSLIHDDLPCMDDDGLRRGMLTNHIAFGETTALLAGDALHAEAFASILNSDLPDSVRARCAGLLAEAAGVCGICGGQHLDLSLEAGDISEKWLTSIHKRKTAALIQAACTMGAAAAGADDRQLNAAVKYAQLVGMAFQIRDDVLDAVGTTQKLGKTAGSDERAGKTTFFTLFGETECEKRISELTVAACEAVKAEFSDPAFLCELAEYLSSREK